MVCIYCGAQTSVINSRLHKKLNRVWRRRQCEKCQSVFTTMEHCDERRSFTVEVKPGKLRPFSRDKLFLSLYKSCAHRKTAITDAGALADTIISKLTSLEHGEALIKAATITRTVSEVLTHFDKPAATHYQAYHQT
jgi:transcriptional repressor NrdR